MGKFHFEQTTIQGLCLITPQVFADERGFFLESYHQQAFADAGILHGFVQDNHSLSSKGVLRGLHLQMQHVQAKLVRVVSGSAFDVVVDLRSDSKTRFQWFGTVLSAENKKMLYIPAGFAHGFLTMEDQTQFLYKASDVYDGAHESGIRFDDPDLNIQWPDIGVDHIVSGKDLQLPTLKTWRNLFPDTSF